MISKVTEEGEFITKFLDRYNKAKLLEGNVGWNVIH
jgi:hypothetical protein